MLLLTFSTIYVSIAIYLYKFCGVKKTVYPVVGKRVIVRLSEKELAALQKLKKVTNDGPWGIAIKNTIETFSVETFRQLISQLKSQNEDQPLTMKSILGDAYESFLSL